MNRKIKNRPLNIFQKDDRVRHKYLNNAIFTGTVTSIDGERIYVKWDTGQELPYYRDSLFLDFDPNDLLKEIL